uniref:NADH-ubiquinone oxidoreductase chain 2 n=1 Tax=Petrobius brevistylis TaxID=50562 RepID=Q2TCR6_9INSE|nr:NADH dehydrogenase subunit 2 [Petrobius brevistylis]AAX39850.1 NADH dehydrogenase subunit 2 [Petrobius brevistylis]
MNPAKILFLSTLIGGTLISVSSTSWFGVWMGLEVNLLSFIPLMSNGSDLRSTEASLKYFLAQTLGSVVLILGAIYLLYSFSLTTSLLYSTQAACMINSSILLKLGAAPFHFWLPSVAESLSWANNIILMTWQKLAPLAILSYTNINSMPLINMSIILSALIGGWGGLNQTMLRKLMAFSSINHLAWIMSSMLISESLWLFYYTTYVIMSLAVVVYFMNTEISHINQIYDSIELNKTSQNMITVNFLSLGGLPPFLGFMPKWLTIQALMLTSHYVITYIMIMSTLITLFYYIRMIHLGLTILNSTKMWFTHLHQKKSAPKFTITFLSITSALGLPFFPGPHFPFYKN